MNRFQVMALVQEAFDALGKADLIPSDVQVDDDTDLLGPETMLDSIAFVTFIVEVEDRLAAAGGDSGESVSLAINEIHEFNPDKSRLTAGALVDYIMHSSGGGPAA
jgi:hypothetical protein